jgi:hypothetical protein
MECLQLIAETDVRRLEVISNKWSVPRVEDI